MGGARGTCCSYIVAEKYVHACASRRIKTTSEQQDAEKLATEMGAAFGRDESPADRARRSGSGHRSKASLGERGGLQEPLSCGHTDTVLCVLSHGPTKITHIQSLMRCI